jgi:beta-galactosidase
MRKYDTEISGKKGEIFSDHLNMGGTAPDGTVYNVNNLYMIRNNLPWIPVMGEFHFSRYPHQFWREELLKMKAAGITIVATYLFWIHHEEERGIWRWEDDRDLSLFIDLCDQLGLQVWLRIGPWAHGECRNGGFPDWLMEESQRGVILRSDHKEYLACVKEWFDQIARQLPHKKGGFIKSIIGIQLENEYGHCGGAGSTDHVRTLKHMAEEAGLTAPFYTVTGWGGACVPQDEVLVTMGGYAAHPWTQHTNALEPLGEYLFAPVANDPRVGGDLSDRKSPGSDKEILTWDPDRTPYLTCELGGGIQVTDHRRPLLSRDDITANILCKLGSGTNLPGYYMYHGGTNPVGKSGYLQESKESGYPNDLPRLSYDFQAMIGEYGRFSEAGLRSKAYHYFLRDFGSILAPMTVIFPASSPHDAADRDSLRWSVRTDGRSGFVFVNNHVRNFSLPARESIYIKLKGREESILFPPFTLREHGHGFFPFNLDLSDKKRSLIVKTALVQPIARFDDSEELKTTVFFMNFLGEPGQINLIVRGEEISLKYGTESTLLEPLPGFFLHILTPEDADRLWIGGVPAQAVFSDFPVLFDPESNETILLQEKISPLTGKIIKQKEGTYSLSLPGLDKELAKCHELYLDLDIECDQAELFLGKKLLADYFYNGKIWSIGLKRFEELLDRGEELLVKMTPLSKEKEIYFDVPRPKETKIHEIVLQRVRKVSSGN